LLSCGHHPCGITAIAADVNSFEKLNSLNPIIRAEVSYLGGVEQNGNPLGSSRGDIVIMNPTNDTPLLVFDWKTGVTGMSNSTLQTYIQNFGTGLITVIWL
jgi:hypothetical protein